MKHCISLFAVCLLAQSSLQSQSIAALQDLEGLWYQTGRTSVCYTAWFRTADAVLHNRTFSIVCGDTIALSTATVMEDDGLTTMTVYADSIENVAPRTFSLVHADEDAVVWQNNDAQGQPRQIEWVFYGNNFCAFRADGVETGFRHKREQPMHWQFGLHVGMNLNRFPKQHAWNNLGLPYNADLQQLSGQEIAVSAGLVFPETPLVLNFEMGVTHRRVGVYANLLVEDVLYSRDGIYNYYNTYFALVPELFIGKKRNLSISAGFYLGLAQMRDFKGSVTASGYGQVNEHYLRPELDVDKEHGMLAGISLRLPFLRQWQPTVYARCSKGLIGTPVKAASLGVSFRIARK